MAGGAGDYPRDIETLLDTLRGYLHAEMQVDQPKQPAPDPSGHAKSSEGEAVGLSIRVRNDAPLREGGEVVFMGVGLRVLNERATKRPVPAMSRPSDRPDLRRRYARGMWVGGSRSFEGVTSDEQSFGDVLFPGESVVYEIQVPISDLPYMEVTVEGSVSRRHLLHFVQTMKGLEQWTRPLLVETFRAIVSFDIRRPVQAAAAAIPEFGPATTLEELSAFRKALEDAVRQTDNILGELNKVFHSAPNEEIRDHLKRRMGKHLTVWKETCAKTLQVLSSGNVASMQEAAAAVRQQLTASEDINRETLRLMSRFGVTPEELGHDPKIG